MPSSDWVCQECAWVGLGSGLGKRCKWLIHKPSAGIRLKIRVSVVRFRPWPPSNKKFGAIIVSAINR